MSPPNRPIANEPATFVEPIAPPTSVWQTLTPAERAALIERLGPMPRDALPPVGDPHINAERMAEDALDGWFRRRRTKAYIGRGITVYYAGEPRFEPDFFVAFDVEEGPRMSWIVDVEGKGPDFVLEIHHKGDHGKDFQANVLRYARLGMPEYFVFDAGRRHLNGWRQGPKTGTYVPIMPQGGRWPSETLGLELAVSGEDLRFYQDGAQLPLSREIQAELATALDVALVRAEAEMQRAEGEARRADEEARRAEEEARRAAEEARRAEEEARRAEEEARRVVALEAEVAALRAELARLRA